MITTTAADNYGIEGPTKKKSIESIRTRQIKNMIASLMLSQGVPMLLMGDEVRRTQRGNNNATAKTTTSRGSTGSNIEALRTSYVSPKDSSNSKDATLAGDANASSLDALKTAAGFRRQLV